MPDYDFSTVDALFENNASTDPYAALRDKATPEPEAKESWQITKGFKAGIDQTQAMGGGLVAAFGDALGADSLKEWGLSSYAKNMEEARANQGNVQGFTDIEGIEDAADWALYTAGNMAPMLATSLVSGGAGAVGARMLANSAAKKIISAEMAKGAVAKTAAETAAKHLAKASTLGAGLGAYASSAGMETGNIYGELPEVEGRASTAFAHGAVAGALDAIPSMKILKRLGVGKAAGDEITDGVMKFAGKQIMTEGVTEGLQTVVEQHAKYWLDKNQGMFEDHHWKEIIDASAAGAFMGGVTGGATGLLRPADKIKDARDKVAEEGGDALDQTLAGNDALNESAGEPLFNPGNESPLEGFGSTADRQVEIEAARKQRMDKLFDAQGNVSPEYFKRTSSGGAITNEGLLLSPPNDIKLSGPVYGNANTGMEGQPTINGYEVPTLTDQVDIDANVPTLDNPVTEGLLGAPYNAKNGLLQLPKPDSIKMPGPVYGNANTGMYGVPENTGRMDSDPQQNLVDTQSTVARVQGGERYIEEKVSDFNKAKVTEAREAKLPDNLKDQRLLNPSYRQELESSVESVEKEGKDIKAVNPEKDDLFTAIAKHGGIDITELSQDGFDQEDMKGVRAAGIKIVFKKNGRSVDDMAEALVQDGYIDQRDTEELKENIRQQLAGDFKYSNVSNDNPAGAVSRRLVEAAQEHGMSKAGAVNALKKALAGKSLTEKQIKVVSSTLESVGSMRGEHIQDTLGVRKQRNVMRKAIRDNNSTKKNFDDTQAQIPQADYFEADESVMNSELVENETLDDSVMLEVEAKFDAIKAGIDPAILDEIELRYEDTASLVNATYRLIEELNNGSRAERSTEKATSNDNANSESTSRTPLEGRESGDVSQVVGSGQASSGRQEATGQVEDEGELLTTYTEADLQARANELKAQEQQEAAAQAEIDTKVKADQAVDDFALNGSSLPADANPNQTDLLDSPTTTTSDKIEGNSSEIQEKPLQTTGQVEDKPSQKVKPKVSQNKVFTEDAAEKARALLKSKLGQLNTGLDPEMIQAGITLAGYHIEKGARTFSAYASAMVEDLGESVKPYLKSWYMGVKYDPRASDFEGMSSAAQVEAVNVDEALSSTEDKTNVEHTAGSQKQNSVQDERSNAQENILDDGRGSSRPAVIEDGTPTSETEQGASDTLGGSSSSTSRKSGDKRLHNGKPKVESSATGGVDDSRGIADSTGGLFAEQERTESIEQVIESAPTKQPSVKKQLIRKGSITQGDAGQIKERMPFLTDGQVEDVALAEARYAKDDGYGIMFTNGTGTGKTFTGLGVVRRFVDQGKKNILVVVPKQTIADGWMKESRKFFDLQISRLEDTSDKGNGIVVTTYANIGQNDAIIERDWDLVITDESHYLSSDQEGSTTNSLKKLRALTLKEGSGIDRAFSLNPELVKEMKELRAIANAGHMADDPRVKAAADQASEQSAKILEELYKLAKIEEKRLEGIKPADKPRVLFLSATPFAYDKNVVIGQGFLFDWGGDRGGSGSKAYNHADNFQDFMMTHFGYRMRTGKLTHPEAQVDSGLMERAFNSWLKQEGVLSGRTLDSDFDYDRRFILAESAIGKRVDDALSWLGGRDLEDETDAHREERQELENTIVGDNFKYHSRMYFLEALKAKEALPYIKSYVDAGYKVLVMHDYKKGGTINPFRIIPTAGLRNIHREFTSQFSDLIEAFSALPSPIQLLTENFPKALIYNGNVPASKRIGLQDQFNSDKAGAANLMIAQGDAMREGVSIHDTTGKHQRVMIHLGMPVKPTAAIQQEGRTYRTGQASDAIFRYFTIGSNWERYTFASTISQRAGTAENLAMGEMARGLKESFIDAYEEAGVWETGMEGEGKGGKERDNALAKALTPWDMAKSYYFGTKKQGSGRAARGREGADYFATPEPLGMKMVQWADIRGGESVLEPSAGHGAIGRWFPENTTNKAIEQSDELASKLSLRFDGDVLTGDFEDHNIINKYDGIVMNPPYGSGGKQAADHVRKAIKHLRDGGRIVALIPTGPAADKQFDKLLYPTDTKKDNDSKDIYTVADITLPRVTFERAGTSVSTRVLVLEKQTDKDLVAKIQQSNRDYSEAETIEQFFDRLETSEIKPRVKPIIEEETELGEADRVPVSDGAESEAAFTKMDSVHSKQGHDLFVLNMNGEMNDNYDAFNAAAKKLGGFYIRARMRNYYKPKDGSKAKGKPTFSFETAESRDEFLSEIKNETVGSVRFSRGSDSDTVSSSDTLSITEVEANEVIDRITGLWRGGREQVRLVGSFVDLPADIQKDAKEQGAEGDIYGTFKHGKVYLVRDMHNSQEQLESTIFHEAYGHYGLKELFGKDLDQSLNKLFVAIGGARGLNKIAAKNNIDLTDYAKGMIEAKFTRDERNSIMMEELLAHIQENTQPRIMKSIQELYGAIRNWLRRKGLMKLAKFNESDLLNLLQRSKNAVLKAEGDIDNVDTGVSRFSRGDSVSTSETETEALEKLGLSRKQADSLGSKINGLIDKNWKEAWSSFKDRSYEGMFDGMAGLKRAEESAGSFSAAQSGYVGARLATGVADTMHAVLHYGAPQWSEGILQHKAGTRGLLEIFSDLDGDLTNWLAWMGAHRAEELLSQGRENNLTQADIDVLKAKGNGKEALFEQVRQDYIALNKGMLDMSEEAGMIKPGSREQWESDYYVPFYRQSDADNAESALLAPRTKRGLSHQSAGIKALKGGETATNDLLENILTNWIKLTDSAMKNSALLKTVNNLGETDFLTDESMRYEKAAISKGQINQKIRSDRKYREMVADYLGEGRATDLNKLIDKVAKLDSEGFEEMWAIVAPTDPDIIRVQREGKNEYYRVNDPALLRAVAHLNQTGSQDPITKTGRYFKRLLTTGVTVSPDFILRNFIRDAAHAWAINPDGFKFGKDSLVGFKGALKEDDDYRALMFSGASFQGGYVHGTDPESSSHIVRRALEAKGLNSFEAGQYENSLLNTPHKMKNAMESGWQKYRTLGDKVENANRLATFKAAIAAGKPVAQAVFESKDLMDYSLRGNFQAMQWFTDVIPFLNARMQGLSKLGRAAKENPRRVLLQAGMKISAFSIALAMLNDDDERYQQLPDWDKDANWHFFLGDDHYRIPKPFEIGIMFGTLPERMYHTMAGNQTNEKLLWSIKHNVFHTLNINPVPQFVMPVAEVVANRSFFFDTPIEGMSDEGKLTEARYNEHTSSTMKEFGALGKWVGLSPKELQHLWNGYLGTMGMYGLLASDMVANGLTERSARPEWKLEDYPVIKSFFKGSGPAKSTQYMTDVYDRMNEVNEIYRTVRSYNDEGRGEEAKELRKSNVDKLKHRSILGRARKQLGAINKQMERISLSESYTANMKRKKLDELRGKKNELVKRVADMTDEAF